MPKAQKSAPGSIAERLSQLIAGQNDAIEAIAPILSVYQGGFNPRGRPAGVVLLLGPTGTGKTHTVESVATALHGSSKKMLRIDCGEFQMEHEVVKLIGAPPGYLGHRETTPLLTQQKLQSVTSEDNNLSVLLFDEIEKAAASMNRMLLGIFDKAALRLGDNTSVNFENTIIFLTSNLGASAIHKAICPDYFGFAAMTGESTSAPGTLHKIGLAAVKRKFSPEFVNRLDTVVTFQPLTEGSSARILDRRLTEIQQDIDERQGLRSFSLDVSPAAKRYLIKKGTSTEYGARELNRTLHRELIQPIALLVVDKRIDPSSRLIVKLNRAGDELRFEGA